MDICILRPIQGRYRACERVHRGTWSGGVAVESEVAGGAWIVSVLVDLWADKKRDGHQPGSSKFRSRSRSPSVAIRGLLDKLTGSTDHCFASRGDMPNEQPQSFQTLNRELRLNIAGDFRLIVNDRPVPSKTCLQNDGMIN